MNKWAWVFENRTVYDIVYSENEPDDLNELGKWEMLLPGERTFLQAKWHPILRFQPSQFHHLDEEETEWVLDRPALEEVFYDSIKNYRDKLIEEYSLVEREYNGETLGLLANKRTLEAVHRKSFVATLEDDDLKEVNYKFQVFTPLNASDMGYRTVSTGFLQDFYVGLDSRNQVCFDAEKHILSVHEITPFDFIDAATEEMDEYLANN